MVFVYIKNYLTDNGHKYKILTDNISPVVAKTVLVSFDFILFMHTFLSLSLSLSLSLRPFFL